MWTEIGLEDLNMGFTYEELRMIKRALSMEIMRREDNFNANKEVLEQYENLYDKVESMIKEMMAL